MLNDANFSQFKAVYIVCGKTDLRLGIDSLTAIIQSGYQMPMFVPNTLFLFCGRKSDRIKGLLWEGDGFLLLYKRVESGHFTWPRTSSDLKNLNEVDKLDRKALNTLFLAQQGELERISKQLEFLTEQILIMNRRAFGRKSERNQIDGQVSLVRRFL